MARVGERSHGERGSDGEEDRELRTKLAEINQQCVQDRSITSETPKSQESVSSSYSSGRIRWVACQAGNVLE